MDEDNSLEFDIFENVRHNLTGVLMREGRERIEAERIALYVVQGIRDVPKLVTALTRGNKPDSQVLLALLSVLDNAQALDRAKTILLGLEDKNLH